MFMIHETHESLQSSLSTYFYTGTCISFCIFTHSFFVLSMLENTFNTHVVEFACHICGSFYIEKNRQRDRQDMINNAALMPLIFYLQRLKNTLHWFIKNAPKNDHCMKAHNN